MGNIIHISGTTATDENGKLVGEQDAYTQTIQTIRNIQAALHATGAALKDVVRTRMYATNIDKWEDVARAHGEFFGDIRFTTTMLKVSRLISPDMLIEIESEALITGELE